MPQGQPGDRAEDAATPSSGATDSGVLEAEKIVSGAWEQVLLERRDHMESALEAAFVCCDSAYQYLAAAQRAGNPKTISSAHAALEQALELARKSSIACNQVRQEGLRELNRPAREIDEYAMVADPTQPGQVSPVKGGLGPEASKQAPESREQPAGERFVRRVRRRFAQIIMRDQPLTSKPATPRRKYV
jgi:hypothetical protein